MSTGCSLVSGVAVSADGRHTVSGSADNTLKVRDVQTGGLIATFACDAAVPCWAFIADDQFASDEAGHMYFLRLEVAKRKIKRASSAAGPRAVSQWDPPTPT